MFRRQLALWLGICVALFATPVAHAQMTFSLDTVLIAIPHVADMAPAGLQAEATALHANLEMMLATEYLVLPFSTVPDYEDYAASVYLDACPEGQYVGCTFVLGSRAKASWVVAIELTPDAFSRPPDATFTIIDVNQSKQVISFSSKVQPGGHGAVAAGLSLVLDSVIRGAHDEADVRGEVVDARAAWEERRSDAQAAAEELAYAEQDLQILVRSDVGEFDQPKLTAGDLEGWDQRDDAAPWVSLGMSRSQYVRYKNRGWSIEQWRQSASGRQGRFLISLEGAFGNGIYREDYDARWALDSTTLETKQSVSVLQMNSSGTSAFGVEVGYGFHRWFDLSVGVATRNAKIGYYVQREIEGEQPAQLIGEGETSKWTTEFRVRTTFAPMATYVVRPTVSAGVVYWRGVSLAKVLDLSDFPVTVFETPSFVFVEVSPGVEFSATPFLSIYGRFNYDIKVVGARTFTEETGEPGILVDPPDVTTQKGGSGWSIAFGLTARVGPFKKKSAP